MLVDIRLINSGRIYQAFDLRFAPEAAWGDSAIEGEPQNRLYSASATGFPSMFKYNGTALTDYPSIFKIDHRTQWGTTGISADGAIEGVKYSGTDEKYTGLTATTLIGKIGFPNLNSDGTTHDWRNWTNDGGAYLEFGGSDYGVQSDGTTIDSGWQSHYRAEMEVDMDSETMDATISKSNLNNGAPTGTYSATQSVTDRALPSWYDAVWDATAGEEGTGALVHKKQVGRLIFDSLGYGSKFQLNNVQVSLEKTPATVELIDAKNNTYGVAEEVSANVTGGVITFDETVDITNATITLTDSSGSPCNVTKGDLSQDGKSLAFAADLDPKTTYTLTLSGAADASGYTLNNTVATFTTAALDFGVYGLAAVNSQGGSVALGGSDTIYLSATVAGDKTENKNIYLSVAAYETQNGVQILKDIDFYKYTAGIGSTTVFGHNSTQTVSVEVDSNTSLVTVFAWNATDMSPLVSCVTISK